LNIYSAQLIGGQLDYWKNVLLISVKHGILTEGDREHASHCASFRAISISVKSLHGTAICLAETVQSDLNPGQAGLRGRTIFITSSN
jgi:hypothetical protein